MAETFMFELIAPGRVLISADAVQVVVPGAEGDFTVLPRHAPLISSLRPGIVDAVLPDGRRRFLVRDGVAEVQAGGLTILSQHTLDVTEFAPPRLAEELAAAEAAAARGRAAAGTAGTHR